MNIEQLRRFCLSLPHVTEDIKWGNDLCFLVGGKMFAVTGADLNDAGISFKCTPEKFAELTELEGIAPAAYVARYHWVTVNDAAAMTESEIKALIGQSYKLVFDKLPRKIKNSLS